MLLCKTSHTVQCAYYSTKVLVSLNSKSIPAQLLEQTLLNTGLPLILLACRVNKTRMNSDPVFSGMLL